VTPTGKSKWFQQGRASDSNREEQVVPTGKQVVPTGKSKWFQQGRASGSIREEQVVPTGKSK